ncbi:hypothetical protein BH24ACT5_BH24ACT5_09710 [soil metagenome]
MLILPVTMAMSLVYFGGPYPVDAVAAWILVGPPFPGWNRIERAQRRRRIASAQLALAELAP